ncbi:MAG TPA: winged helix-turn-helix domain-containing protein [Nitrososphaeraceae archaeon]|nr:winged helix-turn-helix domain-containing protein [Nitrososphaeraceae archaeon]
MSLISIKNSWDIDKKTVISFLNSILENDTYEIILLLMKKSKTVYQIHDEINLPLSSIYKRIKKLENMGIVAIDKIHINSRGRKIIFYKSKLRSINFRLNENDIDLVVN